MKYDVSEYIKNGMIMKLPPCQIDDCEEPALTLQTSADGKGKIFICGKHTVQIDSRQKELEDKIRKKAYELISKGEEFQ